MVKLPKRMKKEWQERFGVGLGRLGCLLLDTAVMAVAYLTAFILRFDFAEPHWGWGGVARSFVSVWAVQMLALRLFGCGRLVWRYVSVGDVPQFVCAVFFSTTVLVLLRMALPGHLSLRPPYSITFFNSFLVTGGLLGVRLLWRLMVEGFPGSREVVASEGTRLSGRVRRVLLVGAGEAGNLVARELKRQGGRRQRVVGFLDDDPAKRHARIQGFPVVGEIGALPKAVRRYAVDEVVIAMVRVPQIGRASCRERVYGTV